MSNGQSESSESERQKLLRRLGLISQPGLRFHLYSKHFSFTVSEEQVANLSDEEFRILLIGNLRNLHGRMCKVLQEGLDVLEDASPVLPEAPERSDFDEKRFNEALERYVQFRDTGSES